MKSGKRFENNYVKSVPNKYFSYRFKDGTSSWGGNENVRFQSHNVCDFMLYDGINLILLELKSHKGKSIPLSCIRETQIKEMLAASDKGVISGLLVEFADVGRVFWLDIRDFVEFTESNERKSIPISYFEENSIELEVIKKVKNIKMDIGKLVEVLQ